jgi:hypothetical protein
MRLTHFVCRGITISVHSGSHIGVTHELLLNAYGRAYRIQPSAVAVAQTVSAKLADGGRFCDENSNNAELLAEIRELSSLVSRLAAKHKTALTRHISIDELCGGI